MHGTTDEWGTSHHFQTCVCTERQCLRERRRTWAGQGDETEAGETMYVVSRRVYKPPTRSIALYLDPVMSKRSRTCACLDIYISQTANERGLGLGPAEDGQNID